MGPPVGPALSLQALSVNRRGRRVVDGVSLSVPAGHWCAVVGPNGAGKSSLMLAVAGLLPASHGRVELLGRPMASWAPAERARHLAWLGQDPVNDVSLSVFDTVALGRMAHHGWLGWPRLNESDRSAIDIALQDTDMAWARERHLAELSGGERQRVHLARALAVQAPVLLLDEPAVHLDAPHQRLLVGVIRRHVQAGGCVVSVMHELPLALAADQVAVMQAGRLQACGPVADAEVRQAIEGVFDHAVQVCQVAGRWTTSPCF